MSDITFFYDIEQASILNNISSLDVVKLFSIPDKVKEIASSPFLIEAVSKSATMTNIFLKNNMFIGLGLNQLIINEGGESNDTLSNLYTIQDIILSSAGLGVVLSSYSASAFICNNYTFMTAISQSNSAVIAVITNKAALDVFSSSDGGMSIILNNWGSYFGARVVDYGIPIQFLRHKTYGASILRHYHGRRTNSWLSDISNGFEYGVKTSGSSIVATIGYVCNSLDHMTSISNSTTAMTAIANSSTAMQAILSANVAMSCILSSQIAMSVIANNKTAAIALMDGSYYSGGRAESALFNYQGLMINQCLLSESGLSFRELSDILSFNSIINYPDLLFAAMQKSVRVRDSVCLCPPVVDMVVNNSAVMTLIASDTTCMNTLAYWPISMQSMANSTGAASIIANSSTAMNSIAGASAYVGMLLNSIIVSGGGISNAILSSLQTWIQVTQSEIAIAALLESTTARNALLLSNSCCYNLLNNAVSLDLVLKSNYSGFFLEMGLNLSPYLRTISGSFDILLQNNTAIAYLSQYPINFGLTQLKNSQYAMTTIAGSSVAMRVLTESSNCVGVISNSTVALEAILSSNYYVGSALNQIMINGGGNYYPDLVNKNTLAEIYSNITSMARFADNAAVITALGLAPVALSRILTNATAYVDYIINRLVAVGGQTAPGLSGLPTLTNCLNNATVTNLITASSYVMTLFTNMPSVMAVFASSSTAMSSLINSTVAMGVVSQSVSALKVILSNTAACYTFLVTTPGNPGTVGAYVGTALNNLIMSEGSPSVSGLSSSFAQINSGNTTFWQSDTLLDAITQSPLIMSLVAKSSEVANYFNIGVTGITRINFYRNDAFLKEVSKYLGYFLGAFSGTPWLQRYSLHVAYLLDNLARYNGEYFDSSVNSILPNDARSSAYLYKQIAGSKSLMKLLSTSYYPLAYISGNYPNGNDLFSSNYYVGRMLGVRSLIYDQSLYQCNSLNDIVNSSAAMTVVAGNNTIMSWIVNCSVVLKAIFASSSATTIISGSSNAMTYIAQNTGAMKELVNNSVAMQIIATNSTAMTAIAASASAMDVLATGTNNIGAALNRILMNGGGANNSTLAGLQTADAIVANSAAMTAIAPSSAVMTAIGKSDAFVSKIYNAISNVGLALNSIYVSIGGATNSTLSGLTTMTTIVANSTAMGIIAGTWVFVRALKLSSVGMAAINTTTVAMDALYYSGLATKVSYITTGQNKNGVGIAGACLFVRMTTYGNGSGWSEGYVGNEAVYIDGIANSYSTRAANPYNHSSLTASPRIPITVCSSSLSYKGYNPCEIAYI